MTQTLERPKTARARTSKPTKASAPPVADEPATQPVDPASDPINQPEPASEPTSDPAPATSEPAEPAESTPSESLGDTTQSAAEVEDEPADAWDHAKVRERREAAGLSRAELSALCDDLPLSRIWRGENPGGQPLSDAHKKLILAALDHAEANPKPAKPTTGKSTAPTKDALRQRHDDAIKTLVNVAGTKSIVEARHIVALALKILHGKVDPAEATAEAASTDESKSEATDAA